MESQTRDSTDMESLKDAKQRSGRFTGEKVVHMEQSDYEVMHPIPKEAIMFDMVYTEDVNHVYIMQNGEIVAETHSNPEDLLGMPETAIARSMLYGELGRRINELETSGIDVKALVDIDGGITMLVETSKTKVGL